jgi:hypothetical protein
MAIAQLQTQNSMQQHSMTLNANREQPGILEYDEVTGQERIHSALSTLFDVANQNMITLMEAQNQRMQAMMDAQAQTQAQLARPRQVIRGPDGKIAGIH